MRASVFFILLYSGTCFPAFAHQLSHHVVTPAGSVDRNDRIELAWTVGEVAIESRIQQQESFTEGFHQPYIQVELITPEASNTESAPVAVSVFPNPVAHALHVQFEQPAALKWHLSLLGTNGAPLTTHEHEPGQTEASLDVADLPAGIYYLQLRSDDNTQSVLYKISKIQ